jgi:hypothetical protein
MHRNLILEQRSGLRANTSPELVFGSLTRQAAIDGGCRHRHQQCGGVGSMTSSPTWRSTATSSPSIGASRLPAGIPSTVQQTVKAAMTSGPYFTGRALRAVTILGCSAALSALRA